jgi:hypothetical protein
VCEQAPYQHCINHPQRADNMDIDESWHNVRLVHNVRFAVCCLSGLRILIGGGVPILLSKGNELQCQRLRSHAARLVPKAPGARMKCTVC